MTTPRFYIQLYKSRNGWRFRIKSRNHKLATWSEAYPTRASMMRTVRALVEYTDLPVAALWFGRNRWMRGRGQKQWESRR